MFAFKMISMNIENIIGYDCNQAFRNESNFGIK